MISPTKKLLRAVLGIDATGPHPGTSYTGRIVRSSVARVVGLVATMAVSFFMMPLVIRTFGDHWYGLLVIATGVTNYYYLFDFGLSTAAIRYISVRVAANDDGAVNEAVSTALVIFSILGLIIAGVTIAISLSVGWFARPEDVTALRTILLMQGLGLAISFPINAFSGLVFSQLRYDWIEMYGLARLAVDTMAAIYLITHGYGIVPYAAVAVVSGQLYNAFFYFVAMKLWPRVRLGLQYFRPQLAREMFGYSVWAMVNQISDNLRFKIDALVVAAYTGASLVTHYSIGARLAEYALTLIYRATNFLTPLYAGYHARGQVQDLRARLLTFTRLNALLAFTGGGLLLALGDAFILRWMGPAYRDAYPVLVVLVAGVMVEAILAPASNVLYAVAKHRVYAIGAAVEALVNLGLSIALVKHYGMIGVALGTTIPLLVNKMIVMPLYTCRVIGLPPSRYYASVFPTLLVSGGLSLALYAVVHSSVPLPGYVGISVAAALSMVPLSVLAFAFLLTGEERLILRRIAMGGLARVHEPS